jgi:ADP-ribose pyrophosphatase YjhB (NUDIX family)
MRRSRGALAYIERKRFGRVEFLTQWNVGWRAYSLVGGHKREAESFRQCLTREVGEELGLREGLQFRATREPLARLRYAAWSESADAETDYTLVIFGVRMIGAEAEFVESADPENRWVTLDEIQVGLTCDGRRVSHTVDRILAAL